MERVGDLQGETDGVLLRLRAAQRGAVDVLNDQIVIADVVELADVRMIQRRDRACFLFESLGVFRLQSFDRDRAADARVARLPHLAHSSGAERLVQDIGTDMRAPPPAIHVPADCKSAFRPALRCDATACRLRFNPRCADGEGFGGAVHWDVEFEYEIGWRGGRHHHLVD